MLNNEKQRLITENEIKPNRYAANAMIGVAVVILLVFVLNEMNVYDVDKNMMRLCCLISLILIVIPWIIVKHEKMISHAASKYIIMAVILLLTLIITIILNAHATLVFILPMLLASQYRSYRISWMAFLSSCVSAVISPVIAYFWGTWNIDFLTGYLETVCSVTITSTPKASPNVLLDIGEMALYMILPQLLILSAFGIILFSLTKKGIENLRDQLLIIHMSETDSLTGLLNRNSYETNLASYSAASEESIACIYADVNGLHELNNSLGHSAGDKMLQSVAELLIEQFGKEDTFRIGGDEFLAFAKDIENREVEERVIRIKEATLRQGYQVAIGVAHASASDDGVATASSPNDINKLVETAELKMYEDKERFYTTEGNNRRERN